jgi:hypothetical protein
VAVVLRLGLPVMPLLARVWPLLKPVRVAVKLGLATP